MKDLIVFDLDGTLALIDHRRHLVEKPKCVTCRGTGFIDYPTVADSECPVCNYPGAPKFKPDWPAFFAACVDDQPNAPVIAMLGAAFVAGFRIMIVSGRSEEVRPQTEAWLCNAVAWVRPDTTLVMRPAGDFTPDDQLKRRWLNDGTIPRDRVLCAYDDRDKVVAMWRAEGIPCFQVAPGDF